MIELPKRIRKKLEITEKNLRNAKNVNLEIVNEYRKKAKEYILLLECMAIGIKLYQYANKSKDPNIRTKISIFGENIENIFEEYFERLERS